MAGEQPVQLLFTQRYCDPRPAQSLSPQQLPATQMLLQQKSPLLAPQDPLVEQAALTQVPLPAPEAVWQMRDEP